MWRLKKPLRCFEWVCEVTASAVRPEEQLRSVVAAIFPLPFRPTGADNVPMV